MQFIITASIVAYQSEPTEIQVAAESFLNTPISSKKLFIIDHSPDDRLKDLFIKYENVVYAHHPENRGFGAGHNLAINQVFNISSYHLVLNPDVVFEEKVLPELIYYLDQNKGTALIMPRILDQNGKLQYLAKLLPYPQDLLFKRFLPERWTIHRMNRFQLKHRSYDEIMNVPYLSGCFMLLRCSALQVVGLFDERFFMYPEDIDLTRRLHREFKTIYYPNVHIIHKHEASSYKNPKMLSIHIINMIKYFNKWGWFFDSERRSFNNKVLNNKNI